MDLRSRLPKDRAPLGDAQIDQLSAEGFYQDSSPRRIRKRACPRGGHSHIMSGDNPHHTGSAPSVEPIPGKPDFPTMYCKAGRGQVHALQVPTQRQLIQRTPAGGRSPAYQLRPHAPSMMSGHFGKSTRLGNPGQPPTKAIHYPIPAPSWQSSPSEALRFRLIAEQHLLADRCDRESDKRALPTPVQPGHGHGGCPGIGCDLLGISGNP